MTVYDPKYSSFTMMLTLCLLEMLMSTSALSYLADLDSDASESVKVSMVHHAHIRQKRSARQLPDILHFRFFMDGSTIQLNMTKSEREIDTIPVYTSDGRETTLQENIPIDKDVAVYHDATQGSVVIARRLGDADYHVAGNFHHKSQQYKIWPGTHDLNKRSVVDFSTHRLRKVKEYDLHRDTRVLPVREGQGRGKRNADISSFADASDNTLLHRHRRETASYVIEIGVLPDFSDFSFFFNETGGNTLTALSNMRTYYAFVEESIQLRYSTINVHDDSISVRVWFKYINAATDPASSPWTESLKVGYQVQDDASLDAFTDYIEDTNNAVPEADHYMSFTRLDLEDYGNTGVAGIAYLASLCTTAATSLVENTIDGFTAALAAHELGHSMDGQHDSAVGCDDADRYVMSTFLTLPSPTNPSSMWTFSRCSVASFKTFLAEPSSSCARDTTVSSSLSDGGVPAGQVFDADQQCARAAGTGSRFCRTSYQTGTMFDEMCQVLRCSGPDGDIDMCDAYIALEGTSCGDGKWCAKGMCVPVPSRPTNCSQGDDPTSSCEVSACDSYSATQLLLCCSTCPQSGNTTIDLTETDPTAVTTLTPERTTMEAATTTEQTPKTTAEATTTTEETTAIKTTTDGAPGVATDDNLGSQRTSVVTDSPVSTTEGTPVSSSTPIAGRATSPSPLPFGQDDTTPSTRNVQRFIVIDCSPP